MLRFFNNFWFGLFFDENKMQYGNENAACEEINVKGGQLLLDYIKDFEIRIFISNLLFFATL